MKIMGWQADQAGCAHYRVVSPLAVLARRGHDTLSSAIMPDEWRDTADVIVGQRVCLPGASTRWQQLARQGRAKLVYEVDDDLLNVHHSNKASFPFYSQRHIRDNLVRNMEVADLITVTTDQLADLVSEYNRNVVVLPNCVGAALLDHTPARSEDTVTIGWAGSATHQADWAKADEHVARFVARTPGTEMHVMGWKPPVLWERLPAGRCRFTGWINSVDDLHRALDFHIGVIPLRNMIFNRSKSEIKFTELSALGIPAIASNAGPYAASVQDGITGLLVRKPGDWNKHLRDLVHDAARRDALGKVAKDWAATRTIEGNAHLWEECYLA